MSMINSGQQNDLLKGILLHLYNGTEIEVAIFLKRIQCAKPPHEIIHNLETYDVHGQLEHWDHGFQSSSKHRYKVTMFYV
jgi:hypothetical protein